MIIQGMSYLTDPNKQFVTKGGAPNVGGFVRVYLANTDDPAKTYCDFNGTRNPQDIRLDNNGRAVIIADVSKAYRVEVYDILGGLQWTVQPLFCLDGVSRDEIFNLKLTRGGITTKVYDPLQSPDTEVDINETEDFDITQPGIYAKILQSIADGRTPVVTAGSSGKVRLYYYTSKDTQNGTVTFTCGYDGMVELLVLHSDGAYEFVAIPGEVSLLKGNCNDNPITPEPEGDHPEDWDCYEVEKEGEDIWIGDDKRVHAKAGWYHVDMGVYIEMDTGEEDEKDARAAILFGAYTGNAPDSVFDYTNYCGVDFDLSYGHEETHSVGFDIHVENDGDIIHLSASAPGENTAECFLDWFSIHRIKGACSGGSGGGGGGSGDCNVFIGDVDTSFAEWKAASDAGKALMFSYSFGAGMNSLVVNPMQTKVTVLPTGVVMISCMLAIMDESLYIEMWVQHDDETEEDVLTFAYLGGLVSGRAVMSVDADTGEGESSLLGLLALPGLEPADILNGNFDPADYTTAQLNAAILLGFVKMRTEFDWMLIVIDNGYSEPYMPVPEDKLIGGSESAPALCCIHRGWDRYVSIEGPPTLKYRMVRAVLTYDGDLDEEVLTFPITPIYMNFETDPEA